MLRNKVKEHKRKVYIIKWWNVCYCIVVDYAAQEHWTCGDDTCETYAAFIENHTAEKQHEKKEIENRVATGVETIFGSRPTQATFGKWSLEGCGYWRNNVPENISHHHNQRGENEYCPALMSGRSHFVVWWDHIFVLFSAKV